MKKYETIIFDLDDTLIDNNQSVKYAFNRLIQQLGIEFTEELFEKWKKFDTSYWHEWESGKIVIPNSIKTLEDKITYLRANRFIKFFRDLKIDPKVAKELNNTYCNMLGVNIVEINNARKVLQELNSQYKIFIGTNGPKKAAIHKLEKARLSPYVSGIISSEEVGYPKPMPEFFQFLLNKVQIKDKNKVLLVGDSLTTDILGGINNGIDTCWFNPNNIPIDERYHPTMSINQLLELKEKL